MLKICFCFVFTGAPDAAGETLLRYLDDGTKIEIVRKADPGTDTGRYIFESVKTFAKFSGQFKYFIQI